MNILFIHSSSELYGSDRSLLYIIKNIDKEKFNIHVMLPCQGPLVDEINLIQNVSVNVYDFAILRRKNLSIRGVFRYIRDFFRSYRYIKKYIISNNIDVVDTNTSVVFPGAIAAKHLKKKSVWHIREIIKSKKENKLISWIMNRYSDVIIANSKTTGNALNVNKAKIKVVYNAVEENKLEQIKFHEHITVGMAGRINRWKGQKLFVDAAEIVHKSNLDIRFLIAGEAYSGEEFLKDDLICYIKEKKLSQTVFLLGQINDMSQFYSELDIFVLPSIQPEPFGLVILEAMDYGIPVIATNHGGPTEIILDGEDGYLVDYKDANQMASRILDLVNDRKKSVQIGKEGQYKKRQQFSINKMVSDIEQVFIDVCDAD